MATYTIFNQAATGTTVAADATEYTLAMQFSLSRNMTLDGVWFYTASGAQQLPVACGIFQVTGVGTGTLIYSNTSPTWLTAPGGGAISAGAAAWGFASIPGSNLLTASVNYKVAVAGANAQDWYSATGAYFTTGAGAGGLTSGPISVPGNSGADVGQDGFYFGGGSGIQTLTYPNNSNGGNYWVDVQVEDIATPATAAPVLYTMRLT